MFISEPLPLEMTGISMLFIEILISLLGHIIKHSGVYEACLHYQSLKTRECNSKIPLSEICLSFRIPKNLDPKISFRKCYQSKSFAARELTSRITRTVVLG